MASNSSESFLIDYLNNVFKIFYENLRNLLVLFLIFGMENDSTY